MIEVFFHLTESMANRQGLLDGFDVCGSGRNVCVVIADDDVAKLERLISLVEGFGCAIQIESDVEAPDDELLRSILREYNCV